MNSSDETDSRKNLMNGLWIAAAILTVYFTSFFHNFFTNPDISQFFYLATAAGYATIVSMTIFTMFIMRKVLGTDNIENCPRLLMFGSFASLVTLVSLTIAIWPVWSWFSPLITIIIWKGFFGIPVFLPEGNLGKVLSLLINLGSLLIFYWIERENDKSE